MLYKQTNKQNKKCFRTQPRTTTTKEEEEEEEEGSYVHYRLVSFSPLRLSRRKQCLNHLLHHRNNKSSHFVAGRKISVCVRIETRRFVLQTKCWWEISIPDLLRIHRHTSQTESGETETETDRQTERERERETCCYKNRQK